MVNLFSLLLYSSVYLFHELWSKQVSRLLHDALDEIGGLFVVQVQTKALMEKSLSIATAVDTGKTRVADERKDSDEKRSKTTEDAEGRDANFQKGSIALRSLTTEAIDHLTRQSDGGRQRLGVFAENEAVVDVEQTTTLSEKNVVQMPVSHAQKISDHAIPCRAVYVL